MKVKVGNFGYHFVSRAQGHMGHVVMLCFFIGNMSHRVTKLGHVCDPEDYRSQRHKIGSRM